MANAHHKPHHNVKHNQPQVETQPRLFRFTIKGLLNLPYRLCNPPPAVGKVRSCGLTPIFKVKLEDVLDRKHLPPLGLKDFEEWLLFVEQCPENLYFILWLRDYTAKYNQWAAKSKHTRSKLRLRDREREGVSEIEKVEKGRTGGYRVNWPASTTVSPSLAMSYARAKQTFFAPNSDYALCVPPDLLSPFFRVSDESSSLPPGPNGSFVYSEDEHVNKYFGSPHPDPEVFTDVALYVQNRLNNSLRNCVRAAYSNVGTFRATCGICAGIFITLATALPPLLINFLRSQDRWLRLAAIPGLWLGLTVLCASLKGVCMMVYVFGDFRQLRKFELARPPLHGEEAKVGDGHLHHPYAMDSTNGAPLVRPPVSPPVALTAPPRMPIQFPSRIPPTPSLTYSHGNSYSYYSRPTSSSGASMSMMEGDTTLQTISISSSRKPGGTGTGTHEDDDASSISVPACDSSDDESSIGERRRSSFYAQRAGAGQGGVAPPRRADGTNDEDSDSDEEEEDDCGIYISPAYAPPDDMELIDPAAVEMVVAAAARAGMVGEGGNIATGPGREGMVDCVDVSNVGTMAHATLENEKVTVPPPPTAAFIPPFEYRYEEDELGLGGVNFEGGIGEGGRDAKKKVGDLENGAAEGKTRVKVQEEGLATPAAVLTVTKTSSPLPFDFDALPPVKRERVDSVDEDGRRLMERVSFFRAHTQSQLPTHIEAQVHVQIDSDAEVHSIVPVVDIVDDTRRRETVTSTTLTMLSTPAPNLNVNPQTLSPTSTVLNTNFTSMYEKGGNSPASPMLMTPATGHSGVTFLGTYGGTGNGAASGTLGDEKVVKKTRSFMSLLLHFPSLKRHSDANKPSGCNNYPSYANAQAHHYTTTRKSRRKSTRLTSDDDASDDSSWRPRYAAAQHVPAFGPVTRVLNPVVTRAQWEIVVRAAALALVLSLGIVGALCAVPVR